MKDAAALSDLGTLAALRAEIDALDDAIHDALMRRAAVVDRLARSGAKPREAVLRPGREAAILRRLLARHSGPLPGGALVRLWRELFSSSLAQQTGFAVACAPGAAARLALGHFGPSVPLREAADPLAPLDAREASVAALPWPGGWWATLPAGRAYVVALLPFWRDDAAAGATEEAALLALAPADPSGRDVTLLRARPGALPPGAKPVARHQDLTLAELPGHVAPGDSRLAGAECLGHTALPEFPRR